MSCQELDEHADLALFHRWGVQPLKVFLKKRGLQTNCNKDELCALAYAANYLGLPLTLSGVEKEQQLCQQYKDLLLLEGVTYPDPIAELKDDWISEKNGMKLWPPTMYYDMCEFLLNDKTGVDLAKRVFKDYKEKKGFSFLSSGFLFEISYHSVSHESVICYLKADCRPSQRINNPSHTSWIMVEKVSGSIKRAYCTCIAGRGQSCLHVTAILMKVDMAWQYGLTNPACTSTKCNWISEPKLIVPYARIAEMDITSPKFNKKPVNINNISKQLFVPHKSGKGNTLFQFLKDVRHIVPDAVVYSEIEERPLIKKARKTSVAVAVVDSPQIQLPKTVLQLASVSSTVFELTSKLKSECEAKHDIISAATVMQSRCDDWKYQRLGRVTASKFKQVYTKCKTLQQKGSSKVQDDKLIQKLINGDKQISNYPATKYGINTEPIALKSFLKVWKGIHTNTTNKNSGLVIHMEKPYIGASPDQVLSCDCHGQGILEIKCPFKASHTIPSPELCSYLVIDNNQVKLKKQHEYYFQVQGQMAVCGVKYCEFFVYTAHGYHLETISFDQAFWQDVCNTIDIFWENYLAPVMLSPSGSENESPKARSSISGPSTSRIIPSCSENSFQTPPKAPSTSSEIPSDVVGFPIGSSTPMVGSETISDTSICIVCHGICKDVDALDSWRDYSIGCDVCGKWYHLPCVNLNKKSQELKWPQWYCHICT